MHDNNMFPLTDKRPLLFRSVANIDWAMLDYNNMLILVI